MTGVLSSSLLLLVSSSGYLPFKMVAPFSFSVDGRNPSSEFLAANERAWQTWEDVSCAYPTSNSLGWTTPGFFDARQPEDGHNVSGIWVATPDEPAYDAYFGSSDITALSLMVSYAGVLTECDIYLNGVDSRFSTSSSTPIDFVDVETVVLHEAGHCHGLDHSVEEARDEVMFASVPLGEARRALRPGDQQRLCDLYPEQGAVGSPCTGDVECGAGKQCLAWPAGPGGASSLRCTRGCVRGGASSCEAPFACQPSAAFLPDFDGACLLPGAFVTQVGKACLDASTCGGTQSVCLSDEGSRFPNGYCTEACGPEKASCALSDACGEVPGEGHFCLKRCRLWAADCRPGYTCAPRANDALGVCRPTCLSDADCPGQSCRLCDGACVDRGNPEGRVGDRCEGSETCGPGQACGLRDVSGVGVCTLSCGATACGVCPEGTRCHPVGPTGAFYCLKDCTRGTCPEGLQCGPTALGRGCLPPCRADLECPVGNACQGGECRAPSGEEDAGAQTPVTMPGEGCGCQSGPGLWPGFWFLLGCSCARRQRKPKT